LASLRCKDRSGRTTPPLNELGLRIARYNIAENKSLYGDICVDFARYFQKVLTTNIQSWACCTPPKPIVMPKPQEKDNANRLFSRDLSAEVVTVLVSMALINQKEART